MEYLVTIQIEDNQFQIEANSQEDAEKIAESRCEQYLKGIDYVDARVIVSPNPSASDADLLKDDYTGDSIAQLGDNVDSDPPDH